MKHLGPYQRLFAPMLAILFLGACGTQSPSPSSYEGHYLLYSSGSIFKIPSDLTTEKATDLRIAGPGIHEQYITLWQEKNHLAYRTEKYVQLLNLDTKEVKTLYTGPTHCVTWSSDLAYISYISTKSDNSNLYVYDVALGTSTLVYAAPSATYSDGRTHYGAVTCGAWIGRDRFVFDRTVGMPAQLTTLNGVTEGVSTNTTTLAIISKNLSFVDAPQQLSIYGISNDGRHLIFGEHHDSMVTNLYHVSLPPSFNNFDSLSPRLIASGVVAFNFFTIVGNEAAYDDYEDGETHIRIFNLDTFEERLGPKIPDGIYDWILVGDLRDNLIAYQDDVGSIWLQDSDNHRKALIENKNLLKEMENLGLQKGHLIGWLPSK